MKIVETATIKAVEQILNKIEKISETLDLDTNVSPIQKAQQDVNNKPKLKELMQLQTVLLILKGVAG